jgi:hypothetical protein
MTMVIYEPKCAEGYEWINFVDRGYYRRTREFAGESTVATWMSPTAILVTEDQGRRFRASDFPWLGSHALVMRRSAVDALDDILFANCEVLPLKTNDNVELFVLNTRVVDALDENKSILKRFSSGDGIICILKVSFIPSAIEGIEMFRLPHYGGPTYVSGHFVERVRAAGLRGLDFSEVWTG